MSGPPRAAPNEPRLVLAYHSIDDDGSVLSTSPREFAQQLEILDALGARVVRLEDLWRDRRQPSGATAQVAITFDDGFRSVAEHAVPALARHGFPATVFLVSDYCGKANDWPGQAPGLAPRPLLSWAEARALGHQGISFQCHTRAHPDLTRLPPRAALDELAGSKQRIEDELGTAVQALAYPYGAQNAAVRELAARYFSLACTTRLAFVDPAGDPLAIDRVEMFYLRSPERFRQLLTWRLRTYLALRRVLRSFRARLSQPPGSPGKGLAQAAGRSPASQRS